MQVDPFAVTGKIDYDRIVDDFGSSRIDTNLLQKWRDVTGDEPHHWLGSVFYSHRDLDRVLDVVAAGKEVYIYTGRGPSSPRMHLGHLIPFLFTAYLQRTFDATVVVQMTTDEKFLWKDLSQKQIKEYCRENIRDILASGINDGRRFVFDNMKYIGYLYPTVLEIEKRVNANQVSKLFGFKPEDNIGKYSFPAIQAAPAFSACFDWLLGRRPVTCLVPCGIDQDPFFRMTRDIAKGLNHPKPAVVHSKFFPALQGGGKMSSSDDSSAIFLDDDYRAVKTKINKYAFSGGRDTLEEHQALGGRVEVDVPFQYIDIFETDRVKVDKLRTGYTSGEVTSGTMKQACIELLVKVLHDHAEKRAAITEEHMNTDVLL